MVLGNSKPILYLLTVQSKLHMPVVPGSFQLCNSTQWGRSLQIYTAYHVWTSELGYFQNLLSSLFDTNPANTYPTMIFKHSGQAPTPFEQLFHSMSPREIATHDVENQS